MPVFVLAACRALATRSERSFFTACTAASVLPLRVCMLSEPALNRPVVLLRFTFTVDGIHGSFSGIIWRSGRRTQLGTAVTDGQKRIASRYPKGQLQDAPEIM